MTTFDTKRALELAIKLDESVEAILADENYYVAACALRISEEIRSARKVFEIAPFNALGYTKSPDSEQAEAVASQCA